ncbi:MAG TPA: hypothetical protein VFC29_03615 [Candidatus Limnocylindrales bacterium]|nr:hypothetical protein [Candidatus Limnocylindrales bacterium]
MIDNVMGGELGADSDRSSQAQRTHHASSTSANGLAARRQQGWPLTDNYLGQQVSSGGAVEGRGVAPTGE